MKPPVQISTRGRIAAYGFSRKVGAKQRLPANLSQVATLLSGFNGAAMNLLGDGQYTIVIYSSNTSDADAHLFNIRVHGGDGFDLRFTAGQIIDNDAIEYMGVLREVGAGILVGDNFTL